MGRIELENIINKTYDVIVVGGGHAGIEASLAPSRLGLPGHGREWNYGGYQKKRSFLGFGLSLRICQEGNRRHRSLFSVRSKHSCGLVLVPFWHVNRWFRKQDLS